MGFQRFYCLFWGFYLWILSGSLLSGFLHKRSLDSPSSQLSNHSKSCPDCKGPVFSKPLQNQTAEVGGKANFKCYVSGSPKPEIRWYKNGKIIINKSGLLNIIDREWGSRLKNRQVKLSDAGSYTCVANNSMGTARRQAFLVVNGVKSPTPESKSTLEIKSPPSVPVPSSRTTTTFTTQGHLPKYSKQSNPEHSGLDQGKDKPTTNDLEIPTPSPFPENGSCVIYNGSICSKYLKGQPIYKKSYERLENFEIKISTAYNNIRHLKKISEHCQPFVLPLLCHFQFPSCDKTSRVPKRRQICYEECETLQTKICAKEYIFAKRAELQTLLFPECSTLPRKSSKAGENCIKLGVTDQKIQNPVEARSKASPFTGCYTDKGENFRANVSVTEKGLVCQRWNSSDPHHHIISTEDYPELAGGHNFCRNPGGKKKKPWCFTTDADTKFDFCDVPSCDDPSAKSQPVQVVSILYTVIPCLLFAIAFSSVVIFVCWRYHKQIIYQASQSAATPLVPVVGKPTYPKIKEMGRETVRFLNDLGEGEFGKLYKGEVIEGKEKEDKVEGAQTTRAILAKVLRNSSSASTRECFLRQAETWSKFSHPNVISIVGMCYNGPPTCILYECVEYGTLYDYLVGNSPLQCPVDDDDDLETLSYYDQLQIAIQLAAGMNYLSQHNYIHGDLAARNCVVGPRMTVKISDVALTRNPFSKDYYRSPNRPPMPLRWMAPEGILNYRFTVETDIWSYGVVLWEIFSFGLRPYEGFTDEDVMERIREHELLLCPVDCPSRIFVLMKECWDILPPSRPRFSAIYTHLCELRWDANGPRPVHETYDREYFHVDV